MGKATLYRIIDWDKHFESAQSRKVDRLTWVRVPNKHDGEGYTELLDHPHGPAHFACWVAIIQVASKCQPRGSLLRDGSRPHDCQALARQTRVPAEDFAEAIPRLLSIGWLSSEVVDTPDDTNGSQPSGSELVAGYHPSGARREEKRGEERRPEEKREEETTSASADVCSDQSQATEPEPLSEYIFPIAGKDDPTWTLPQAKLEEYREAFPDLDVDAQIRQARQWVRDNPQKRKKGGQGMLRYLTSWLTRAQNRGLGGASHGQPPRIDHRGLGLGEAKA